MTFLLALRQLREVVTLGGSKPLSGVSSMSDERTEMLHASPSMA